MTLVNLVNSKYIEQGCYVLNRTIKTACLQHI